jgi:mycothiol synthase
MSEKHNLARLTVRNFNIATDLVDLVTLRNAISGEKDQPITVEQQRTELNEPNQTPETDRWIVEAIDNPGTLIGQGFGYHPIPERYLAWIEVHPQWRRQGVGSTLLARVLERAKAVSAEHILIYAHADNKAGHAFLEHHGLWIRSAAWFMSRPAGLAIAPPQWPEGYSVCSFAKIQDLAILWQVCYGSYGEQWGHGENSRINRAKPPETTITDWLSGWEPKGENILLLFDPNNEVAGICRGLIGNAPAGKAAIGWVDAPGVMRKHRHLALQKPLTLAMMHWLSERGQDAFELSSLGDSAATVDLYRAIGFNINEHLIAYHLDI